jgi:N-methylhydantoinase A/oxoprolinase/acetone carboxylase beta subunit
LALGTEQALPAASPLPAETYAPAPIASRGVLDPETGAYATVPVYDRPALRPGARIEGPAVVTEDETATLVAEGFVAQIDALGYIILEKRPAL